MRDDEELARAALDSARVALGADLAAVLAHDGGQLLVELTVPAASVPPVPARDALGPSVDATAVTEIAASELSVACPSPLRGTVLFVPVAGAHAALAFVRRSGSGFGHAALAQVESRREALGLAVRLLLRDHRESGALARYEGILNASPIVVAELARARQECGDVARRAAPQTPAPPSLPAVLDAGAVRALRELTAGDSSVFHDLVRTVIQGIDDGEREIARGLTEGDARAVMMAAHKLRGSTGMVGATGAVDVLEVLEGAGRDGRLSALGTAHEKMRAELAALRVALNALT